MREGDTRVFPSPAPVFSYAHYFFVLFDSLTPRKLRVWVHMFPSTKRMYFLFIFCKSPIGKAVMQEI